MPATRTSYLLCGTPRTGSTLLCDLLDSTGVAGHPASYFRAPDQEQWAARFGVPVTQGSLDYGAFVDGAVREGTTANGVFAARVMWGTMGALVGGLDASRSDRRDTVVLTGRFGPLVMVHLRRRDVVAQAVSWARAEQTGHWQQGDEVSGEPRLDLAQVDGLVRTIGEHDAAWSDWFLRHDVRPHVVTYEDLVTDPRRAVQGILDRLEVELPPGWRPVSACARQSDATNEEWIRRYTRWSGRSSPRGRRRGPRR